MNAVDPWAHEQLAALDAGWDRLMRVIDRLGVDGLERRLASGWSAKQMLAHLAFWEETSLPVIACIYRGGAEVAVEQWYGGADLEIKPGDPWPDADTHNAREARWARTRSGAEVLQRLTRARQQLKTILATVTDDEARGPIGQQWSAAAINAHIDHHLAQVEAMLC